MYALHDLLQILHSDGADRLRLELGTPPVVILDGEPQSLDGPGLEPDDLSQLLHDATTTRQRRELHERGRIQILYQFRPNANFVVKVWIVADIPFIEIW